MIGRPWRPLASLDVGAGPSIPEMLRPPASATGMPPYQTNWAYVVAGDAFGPAPRITTPRNTLTTMQYRIRCGSRGATPRGQQEPALTVIGLDGVTDDRAASGAFVPSLWLVRTAGARSIQGAASKPGVRAKTARSTAVGLSVIISAIRCGGGEPCHTV